jgi:hypothetical protein
MRSTHAESDALFSGLSGAFDRDMYRSDVISTVLVNLEASDSKLKIWRRIYEVCHGRS